MAARSIHMGGHRRTAGDGRASVLRPPRHSPVPGHFSAIQHKHCSNTGKRHAMRGICCTNTLKSDPNRPDDPPFTVNCFLVRDVFPPIRGVDPPRTGKQCRNTPTLPPNTPVLPPNTPNREPVRLNRRPNRPNRSTNRVKRSPMQPIDPPRTAKRSPMRPIDPPRTPKQFRSDPFDADEHTHMDTVHTKLVSPEELFGAIGVKRFRRQE